MRRRNGGKEGNGGNGGYGITGGEKALLVKDAMQTNGPARDSYETLRVWQEGYNLALDIYRATRKYPDDERYGITSQMRRAATSVPANIAEGDQRATNKDNIRFLYTALGSLAELHTFTRLSSDLEYIEKSRFAELSSRIRGLTNMLNSYIASKKGLRSVAAIFVLAASFASFASVPSVAAVKNPDTYVYASISDIDSLDPAWAYDAASQLIIDNVYETLVAYDGSSVSKLVPVLATKVPTRANGLLSKDGRAYTFPIRKGVKFHAGGTVTPEDVRYSIMRFCLFDRDGGPSSLLLEPLTGHPATRDADGKLREEAYEEVARAVQVEGDNVVVRLPTPFAPLLTIFATWADVVSKDWMVKHGAWDGTEATWKKFNNPVKEASPIHDKANGTAPFKLERWDKGGKEIVLERFDGYWRAPAKLQFVRIKGINEFSLRKLMLQNGDADVILSDWPEYNQLKGMDGVSIQEDIPTAEMNPILYFTFDIEPTANPDIGSGKLDGDGIPRDFFSDLDVRKGFAYAFDYQALIRDVYRGKATQATGCIPKTLPYYDPEIEPYHYDLKKAEEHFRKAWGGKLWDTGFKLTFSYNEGNVPRQLVAVIQKHGVEAVNPKFRIEVRPIQWSTFLDRQTAHKLPLFVLGWNADYPDAHNFVFPMMHSKGTYPQAQRYHDAEADKLIEEAVRETSPVTRKALYDRVQQLEHDQVPHLVFVDFTRYRAARSWVKGFVPNPIFPDSPYGSNFYTIYKQE